jgi:hypothetical protein
VKRRKTVAAVQPSDVIVSGRSRELTVDAADPGRTASRIVCSHIVTLGKTGVRYVKS